MAIVRRRPLTVMWAIPLAVGTLLPGWLLVFSYLPWTVAYWSEIRLGTQIASRIESFRELHTRLPNPEKTEELLPLGFELQIDYYPAYRLMGSNAYELEYYIGLDGPRIIYSSSTQQWRCELCN